MITKRPSCGRSSFTEDDDLDYSENSPAIKNLLPSRKKSYKKWTKDEDDRLREYISNHDGMKDWSSISKYVGNGRTDAQCQHRWERFLDPSITKGPWTDEEDKKVIELVRDYGAKHWSLIAKELKGRVGKQCRERWHNHLNPLINKNPWTNEENLRLFILHQHFGNKWAEIARYFNGRSDNSIKNHWNSSMKKKFHMEVEHLKRQGLDWTALIPPDFQWPNIEQSSSAKSNRSSRVPLGSLTNRSLQIQVHATENILSPVSVIKTEHHIDLVNSNAHHQFYSTPSRNNFDITPAQHLQNVFVEELQSLPSSSQMSTDLLQHHSSHDVEHLLFGPHSSPIKQLPMLSSCADYISSSQSSQSSEHHLLHHPSLHHSQSSIDYFSSHPPSRSSSLPVFSSLSSSSPHLSLLPTDLNLFPNDDPFLIQKPNENINVSPTHISNIASPSKYHVLNTPERPYSIRLTPSPKQDCFNEYLLPLTETITVENQSFIRSNKYEISKNFQEKLGYNPSYNEVLIGQTRDQRYMIEQSRRYLSCSSLNYS